MTHLVAGFDFTYGVKGSGTMDDLAQFAQERFTYTIVEKLSDDNEKKFLQLVYGTSLILET